MKKRLLALILAVIMVTSMLPANASAYSTGYPNTWTNTGNQAYDMTQIALTQAGYAETGSNHTKYNAWYYGYDKADPWCAIFVSWCADQAGAGSLLRGASTYQLRDSILSAGGRKISYGEAQPGDIVFVNFNGGTGLEHVEIVYEVNGGVACTISGNKDDVVFKRNKSNSSGYLKSKIVSIYRPNYSNTPTPPPHTTHTKGAFQFYEAQHPHYNYWRCSVCGENFTDGSTARVSTCSQCNPTLSVVSQETGDWTVEIDANYDVLLYEEASSSKSNYHLVAHSEKWYLFCVAKAVLSDGSTRYLLGGGNWVQITNELRLHTHVRGKFGGADREHPHKNRYTCAECRLVYADGTTTPDNTCLQCHWEHVWDGGKITQEPSASQPGVRTFTCTICGETKTETIEAGINGKWGNNITWHLVNGVLTIRGTGEMGEGYAVAGNAQGQIQTVIIEDGVTSIGFNNFMAADNLTKVTLPDSITSIAGTAFKGCSKLTSINLPPKLRILEREAFAECSSLTNIIIPEGVTEIEPYCFYSCGLTQVTIPSSVVNLGFVCFAGCSSLRDIYYSGTKAQWEQIPYSGSINYFGLDEATIHCSDGDINGNEPTPTPDPTPVPTPAPTPGNPGGPGGFDPTPEPEEPPTVTFQDVPASAYYAQAVSWAVANGITSGVGPGQFGPDMRCTRAQMVTFLWKAQGQPEPESAENPFVDVKPSDYCYKAVLWAVENGISGGTDSTHFSPSLSCDRSQAVTFIWRTEGKPEAETRSAFSDVSSKSYYAKAIDWAVEYGIVNGVGGGKYDPKGVCSRAQIVTMLYRDAGN